MKNVLILLLFIMATLPVRAQANDDLDLLLKERSELIKEYNFLNAQNSNFWGKKSKKDLLRIIDNLKGIIKKDSEIINTIQSSTIRRSAELEVRKEQIKTEVQENKRFVTDRVHELNEQLKSSQNLAKVKQARIVELEEGLKEQKESAYERDRVILVLGSFCILLIIYIMVLRIRRKKVPVKRKQKRV